MSTCESVIFVLIENDCGMKKKIWILTKVCDSDCLYTEVFLTENDAYKAMKEDYEYDREDMEDEGTLESCKIDSTYAYIDAKDSYSWDIWERTIEV